MARCKNCIHYDVCAKECRMVQIDEHTWDDYNQLDDVELFCNNYIATADVVPKSEVEKLSHKCDECAGCTQGKCDCASIELEAVMEILDIKEHIAELKKKYMEEEK